MELLVIAVLAGAALQSILKLALLPLRWRIPLCAVAVLPALIWRDRLATFNYQRMLQQLGSSELLATLCLGVVLQELLTLVVGWKLLDEKQQKSWRSVVLLPSILLIPGSFYLEIFCFNYLVGWNFGLTAALLAAVGAAVLLGGSVLARKPAAPGRPDRRPARRGISAAPRRRLPAGRAGVPYRRGSRAGRRVASSGGVRRAVRRSTPLLPAVSRN